MKHGWGAFSLSSLHSHAPRMIQPLLTQFRGAARLERKQGWGLKSQCLFCVFFFLHYVGLLAILPQDNRSLCGAAQPGRQQWQSPANLLTETNLFDMSVQDMDLKSCLDKKRKRKKSVLNKWSRLLPVVLYFIGSGTAIIHKSAF